MNDDFSKLQFRQTTDEQTAAPQLTPPVERAREFATVEELIRADREETALPGQIAARVNESIAREPAPPKPWWKRMLGG